jgi:hypothetical protein
MVAVGFPLKSILGRAQTEKGQDMGVGGGGGGQKAIADDSAGVRDEDMSLQ